MLSEERKKEKNLEFYKQTINAYHIDRDNMKFNFSWLKCFANTSKIYLRDLTNQEIKTGIISLENNVKTHEIDLCHAWYEIFQIELVQRRKLKILKIKNNIKNVGR